MPVEQRILAVLLSLALLFFIVLMVSKRKLLEEFSWIWISLGVLVFVFAIWHDLLIFISKLLKVSSPINILNFLGIFSLICMNLLLSVKLSLMKNKFKNLVQKVAIMEGKVNNEGNEK